MEYTVKHKAVLTWPPGRNCRTGGIRSIRSCSFDSWCRLCHLKVARCLPIRLPRRDQSSEVGIAPATPEKMMRAGLAEQSAFVVPDICTPTHPTSLAVVTLDRKSVV